MLRAGNQNGQLMNLKSYFHRDYKCLLIALYFDYGFTGVINNVDNIIYVGYKARTTRTSRTQTADRTVT